ncbi:hypothetical protein B0T26DRAFT_757133 [Lasiosphaeria miniovina]|uniref:Tc toxin complex TcA C-terminal TcB-binding domain-containing protein n=1 Tax=Lasiosphaeria miniovina TaxID=1954250 RepID=A0AA39ZU35_9PEZI|nr:uncharacterized protein B0T26DRAFT_757133 [Lasiosphaeria miniovina]KAK0703601.1 hypothetical protein B0T26DRAFT_757133 [Lasiosphaeria miniovina]
MTSLPPDQSLRIQTLNQRRVLLSVAERGITIGDGTPDRDFSSFTNGVHFFAENVAVTSDISAPYGITISAWELACSDGGAVLKATGLDGQEDGDAQHRDGGPGGPMALYIQNLDDSTSTRLTLEAHGGAGGNVTSASGTVGDGGHGGSIPSVLQPTYVRVLAFVDDYFNRNEFHSDDETQYGNEVAANSSLYNGAKAVLSTGQSLSATDDVIKSIFGQLSDEITKIDNQEKRTVRDVKLAIAKARRVMKQLIATQQSQLAPTVGDIRGGYPGVGVGVAVSGGKQGANGQHSQVFLQTWSPTDLAGTGMAFAHPVQCAMLLTRANLFFYINSPKLRSHARRLYQRLIDRLSFLPLQPSDTLRTAYDQSPIMPSTSVDDLQNIATEAANQLVHLNSGLVNYCGFAPLWVPRASYTFYDQTVGDALDNLTAFENAYIKYSAALASQEDLNDQVKLAYDKTSNILASLDADISDLKRRQQDLNLHITNMTPVVETARSDLMKAYNAELDSINSAFGLSVPQIINALTMIAFSPGKAMGILQAGSLVYQGFTSIPTIDGVTVSKKYLASEMRQSEATVQNVSVELRTKIDGEYQLDDAFAKRLILARDQLMSQLDEFSHLVFGGVKEEKSRQDLEDKFSAFIDAVTARNGLIFKYNITLKLILSKLDEKAVYETKKTELANRQIKNDDPDLPAITAYVEGIYQASRSRVTRLLDILLRSLNFRMLIHSDVYDYAFQGTDPNHADHLDDVPLSLTSIVLQAVRENIKTKFNKEVEYWGSEPAKFPDDFDKDIGKRYFLNKYQRKALLGGDHAAVFTISPVYKYSANGGDFVGCCNVRVYRVRFRLTGLAPASSLKKDEDALVRFTLRQGGRETLVDRSNAKFEFDHDEVSTVFSFRVNGAGDTTPLDNGNIAGSDIDNMATSYAAPGPFAEWTVDMSGTEFDKLDVTGVTEAYLDFCGTNYAYS